MVRHLFNLPEKRFLVSNSRREDNNKLARSTRIVGLVLRRTRQIFPSLTRPSGTPTGSPCFPLFEHPLALKSLVSPIKNTSTFSKSSPSPHSPPSKKKENSEKPVYFPVPYDERWTKKGEGGGLAEIRLGGDPNLIPS